LDPNGRNQSVLLVPNFFFGFTPLVSTVTYNMPIYIAAVVKKKDEKKEKPLSSFNE